MSNNFETIIGLEVHVELNTNSKVFSPSRAAFGGEPNEFTNEYDWAYPGTLPRLNEGAIAGAMKASLALNMDINQVTYWDRKNYYYPDLPSGYQMTQDLYPIGHDGYLDVDVDGETRRIRIERLHLEQDAGKNIHGDDGKSYVDLNRAGTSLCEIVTYPDIRSPQEAYNFLVQLQETILYTGVSDVKMEEGSLRCDANISIRPIGQEEFNPKTEIKNLNSFNFIKKALEYEEKRQAKNLVAGKENSQQTRRYDSEANKTIVMREKSAASGYRQIPDPDVPILEIEDAWVDSLRQSLPEMPVDRRKRYVGDYGVSDDNALVLTATKEMSDFYEATIAEGADPEQAANWIVGDLSAHLNKEEVEISDTELTPESLKDMIQLIADGTISSKMAKKLFQELVENGGDANEIVEAKGWKQISSEADLLPFINEAIEENPQSVSDYQAGKGKAMGYLVGQIMQKTRGQANPQMVNQLLKEELDKL